MDEANKKQIIETQTTFSPVDLIKLVANYELGLVAIDTEETAVGERHLQESKRILSDVLSDHVSLILFKLCILNQLGYLKTGFADYETSLELLTEAKESYAEWTNRSSDVATYNFTDVFRLKPDGDEASENKLKVEKAYTTTVYFLAQVYQKLDRNDLSADFCQETLRRQLELKDYDPIDWALNSATLSQYIREKGNFRMSRHLMACAQFTLRDLETRFGQDEHERLQKAQADVNRIIAKYCLCLLEKDEPLVDRMPLDPLLTGEEVSEFEDDFALNHPTNFNQARKIFLDGQKALNDAIKYLTLDEHASSHAECIMDQSKLFRLLIKYETGVDRICKMHKRRVDLLENLLKELNPKYFLPQTRQIMFESAETFSEMVKLKLSVLEDKEASRLTPAVTKINGLIQKAILHFENFVRSFSPVAQDESDVTLPEVLDEDSVKPVTIALFSVARLYSKILTSDRKELIKNWTRYQSYYQNILDYFQRHPEQESIVPEELELIKEMIPMIPEKIKLLMNATTLY